MSWGLFVLILVLFIAFSVLLYLQIDNFSYFMESYFIIVIVVIFIILIFTLDFDNPITQTVYIQGPVVTKSLTFQVPYNADTGYSNLISATFSGVWKDNTPTNNQLNTVTFNYGAVADNGQLGYLLGTDFAGAAIKFTKLPNYQMQVDIISDKEIDGFLTMTLLCTGSQDIESSFKQL